MPAEHFPGCHPEDAEDQRPSKPAGEIESTENCWHCGTPTTRGCNCADCWDAADYIPPTAIYHCPLCKRWWAYMTGLNITEITFGERCICGPDSTGEAPDERPDCPVHGADAPRDPGSDTGEVPF